MPKRDAAVHFPVRDVHKLLNAPKGKSQLYGRGLSLLFFAQHLIMYQIGYMRAAGTIVFRRGHAASNAATAGRS